jgi:ATP-dependent exoDNAse (exonuclease V) alpha subunit
LSIGGIKSILEVLAAKGIEIGLAAPTGRAAKRLGESTGRDAKTIHRLLEVDPRHGSFRRKEDSPTVPLVAPRVICETSDSGGTRMDLAP